MDTSDKPTHGEVAQSADRHEIAAVDASVQGYEALVNAAEARGMEVILLSGMDNSVSKLAETLEGHEDIDSLHLFSHGSQGKVYLGDSVLSSATLQEHGESLTILQESLSEAGDLLLYGCDVGAGETGATFLEELARATGADVAASDTVTGHTELGGDWELEVQQGSIETELSPNSLAFESFRELLAWSGTIAFGGAAGGSFSDSGGTSGSSTENVIYSVAGYALTIDGHQSGVKNFSGSDYVWIGYKNAEDYATLSFGSGYTFAPQGIDFHDSVYTGEDDTFTITGYYNGVATGDSADTSNGTPLDLSSFSTVTSLKITKTGGDTFIWGAIDSFQVDSLAPANTAPAFTSATTLAVDETATNDGSVLFDVQANDGDGGASDANVTYSIVGGTGQGDFTIDSDDGELRLNATGAGSLDHEDAASVTLTIRADDGAASDNTTDQTLTVTVNDIAPAITAGQSFGVNESDTDGTSLGSVATTGDDDSVTFSIESGNAGSAFAIDSATGELTLNDTTQLDASATGSYTLGIRASDGTTNADQTVTVNVTDDVTPDVTGTAPSGSPDANDASVDFSVTFDEGVTGVSADDFTLATTGSAGGNIVGVAGSGDTYTVTVDGITGSGTLRLDLDGGTDIDDGAGNAPAAFIGGTTHDVDRDAPTLTNDAGSTDEDTSTTLVADLRANDSDAVSATADLTVTRVDSDTGKVGVAAAGSDGGLFTVTAAGAVTFDPNGEFESLDGGDSTTSSITVTVSDEAGNTATQTVTATIDGANDAPTTTGVPTDVTVTEDTASNVDLSAVTFADVEGDSLTVTLAVDAGTFGTPADGAGVGAGVTETLVNGTTLTLAGTAADINTYLDTASNLQYTGAANASGDDQATLTITPNDGKENGTAATVNIDITGANDAPTDIALASASVNQSGGTNATVGTLSASDVDVGDSHTFSLIGGTGDDDNARFNIDSGSLRANDAAALAEGTYSVRVQADDGQGGTFSEAFTISVADDRAPTLADSDPADDSTGHLLDDALTLTFSEAIAFGSGSITLRQGGTDAEVFDVTTDAGTGDGQVSISDRTLTLNPTGPLDADTAYAIQIDGTAITDTSGSTNPFAGIADDTTLNFTTADTAPSFTQDAGGIGVSLDEDGGAFDLASALEVADISDNETLTFSITGDVSHGTLTGIDGQTLDTGTSADSFTLSGASYTPNADYAGSDSFDLQVSDGTHTASTTVTLTVDAVNDAPSVSLGGNQDVGGAGAGGNSRTVSGFATGFTPGGGADEGSQTVLDYLVTEASDASDVVSGVDIADNGDLSFTPADGVEGTATLSVRVQDDGGTANGGSDTSAAQTFDIHVDTLAPTVQGARIDGDTLTLTFDDTLSSEAGDTPAPGDFSVTADGTGVAVASGGVAISGKTLTLTLASAVGSGTDVLIDHAPGTNVAEDDAGNLLAGFTALAVTNDTRPPSPGGGDDGTPPPEPTPDNDGDGVTDDDEARVPSPEGDGTGDGNGDGVADIEQGDVSSVPFLNTPTAVSAPGSAPEVFITLAATDTDDTVRLRNIQQLDAPDERPDDLEMPLGLIAFDAEVETPGGTQEFSLFVDGDVAVNGYWKQDLDGEWVNLASEAFAGSVTDVGGKRRLDFTLTDGGRFDDDGVADGIITDPGALGFLPEPGTPEEPEDPDEPGPPTEPSAPFDPQTPGLEDFGWIWQSLG